MIKKLLYIAGGCIGYYYLRTATALMKMKFSIAGVKFKELSDSTLTGALILRADNTTTTNIRFQQMTADLFIDQKKIGRIDNTYDFNIPPRGHAYFQMDMKLSYRQAGRMLWNAIDTLNTNVAFAVKGTVRANNKPYPLDIKQTANELVKSKKLPKK